MFVATSQQTIRHKIKGCRGKCNLKEENAFVVCYFQSVYVNQISLFRVLERIQTFFSSPIGKERIFAIPISSACAEALTPINRSILVAGRLLMTNLATLL